MNRYAKENDELKAEIEAKNSELRKLRQTVIENELNKPAAAAQITKSNETAQIIIKKGPRQK
jgi:hypothetical protein